jgi:TolB-like protein
VRVRLLESAVETDVLTFRALQMGDPVSALQLYAGPLLDGFTLPEPAFDDWLKVERAALQEMACETFERAARWAGEQGDYRRAIELARRLVKIDPYREASHRQLMELLAATGARADAIRQYQACEKLLGDELGVEPEAETTALLSQIKAGESVSRADLASNAEPDARPFGTMSLPHNPSIAVLPFTNMSGDPGQEYFADGMAEDIITALSRFRSLFVIARTSTFTYKGLAVDVKKVAHDLGVRYVLEGSVRRIGKRIRVTGKLIDAQTGNNIWAERYDREDVDLHAIQDEITDAIVAAIEPEVDAAERGRVLRKAPETLDAWGLYQKGLSAYYSSTEQGFQTAVDFFDRVNVIDPGFALAYAMGAEARFRFVANWNPEHSEILLAEATTKAQHAIALDPRDSMCLAADARIHAWQGEFDLAIAKANQAVALNPNHAHAHHVRGVVLAMANQPQGALDALDQAIRLNPNSVFLAGFQMVRSAALFQLGRFDEAVEWGRRSVRSANPRVIAFAILAASLSELERMDEAQDVLKQLFELQPNFRLSRISGPLSRTAGPRLADALRKAGAPE